MGDNDVAKEAKILDLGCGNGYTCVELAEEGYENVTGVDYSEKAIALAKSITEGRDLENEIKYEVSDLLDHKDSFVSRHEKYFDLLFDKGTYDAISLNPEGAKLKRLSYISSCKRLLKPGGLFAVTSCNWTFEELKQHFCDNHNEDETFEVFSKIPTPSFKFGGVVRNQVTSVILKLNKS